MAARNIKLPAGSHPYALQWSPYGGAQIAVACAENYGVAGAGQLLLLNADLAQVKRMYVLTERSTDV